MPANADERTEAPTPRRRREARTKGQVARSQDLTAAMLLVAAFLALRFLGPWIWEGMLGLVAASLRIDKAWQLGENLDFAGLAVVEMGKRVAPILLVLFGATLLTLFAQVGPLLTSQPLVPDLGKISPLSGLKRLFSVRSAMLAAISFGKLLVVAAVAYITLVAAAAAVIYAFAFDFRDIIRLGAHLMFDLGIKLAAALLVLSLLDLAWQRFRHERDLRMTREEVKDELRNMEGDPQVKRRRRELQFQMAMRRLRKDVPTADVVVTNPTHYAVAIRYDAETMSAPKVVAKGADYLALRIRQIAVEFNIPIVERRALARALHDSVEVGQYIPERFYRAIAEILAYIYELSGRSLRRRRDLVGA